MQEKAPWLVANRYEVGEVVGRGGYGMVCRGLDRATGRSVALKMLSPEAGRDPDVVERMLREQQALVALSGTCAVTAIDLCRLESGAPCLVMEWLDGRDLEQQLGEWEQQERRGSTEQLLAVLEPLTRTLQRAHDIGLVHRDVKPANIFITAGSAEARLLDFGLSRMKTAAPLTQFGMVMGSPSYIAPETWRGNSTALDGRADLFSLAVIVFRWLTGKLPFDAPDLIGKMNAVTSGPRPSVVALRPELAPALDAWMARALATEPDARFQSASELYQAFVAAVSGAEPAPPSSDASGVRARAELPSVSEWTTKGPFASAWRAASSLLKRFTGTRDSSPHEPGSPGALATPLPDAAPAHAGSPSAPPPARPSSHPLSEPSEQQPARNPAPSAAPERPSVWLDSSELEELASESVRAPAADAAASAPDAASQGKGKGKRSKGKGKKHGKSKAGSATDAKAPGKDKPAGKKSRAKKRKSR